MQLSAAARSFRNDSTIFIFTQGTDKPERGALISFDGRQFYPLMFLSGSRQAGERELIYWNPHLQVFEEISHRGGCRIFRGTTNPCDLHEDESPQEAQVIPLPSLFNLQVPPTASFYQHRSGQCLLFAGSISVPVVLFSTDGTRYEQLTNKHVFTNGAEFHISFHQQHSCENSAIHSLWRCDTHARPNPRTARLGKQDFAALKRTPCDFVRTSSPSSVLCRIADTQA